MARRAELVALQVEDLASTPEGDGVARLQRSKTDQEVRGSDRYLSAPAVTALRSWLEAAHVESGPIFRRLHSGKRVARLAISSHEVAQIFKAAAE